VQIFKQIFRKCLHQNSFFYFDFAQSYYSIDKAFSLVGKEFIQQYRIFCYKNRTVNEEIAFIKLPYGGGYQLSVPVRYFTESGVQPAEFFPTVGTLSISGVGNFFQSQTVKALHKSLGYKPVEM
jgi:hypothetical protein